MKKAYAFLAEGFEIVECMAVVDVLRRGGVDVTCVSITDDRAVVSSHKVTVMADALLLETDLSDADCLFLPGGMPGTRNLMACRPLCNELKAAALKEGVIVSAICAAPSVLGQLGILAGKKCTCYPGFEDKLIEAEYIEAGVVTDGDVITGRGMGVAVDMGIELLAALCGREKADTVKQQIQHPDTLDKN